VQPTFTWSLTSGGGSVSASGLYTAPSSGTLATVTATTGSSSNTASVYVLTSPWSTQDIGSVAPTGAAGDNGNGGFTLLGSGSDIGGTADNFRFAYQTMTGDGVITARVVSVQNTNTAAKAGVMIRSDLTTGSIEALMAITPGSGAIFEERITASSASTSTTTSGLTAPYWVRLVRSGTTFTGFTSADGVTWTQAGSAVIAMGATVDIGLAVTSRNNGVLNTATFDHVSIDQTPTVATAAAATPSPASGTTTNLSVLGADLAGESTLTYTWAASTVPTGAGAPTFASNGTNASKSDVATFQRAGTYTFQVTITNGVGLSTTSSVSVVVNQTVTSITIAPATVSLIARGAQQFSATALDQFNVSLTTQPTFTWSVAGGGIGGTITATGLYSTPGLGTGGDTVKVSSGTVSTTAAVSVKAGPATQLVVAAQPSGIIAGVGFGLVLMAEDGFGNVDPSFNASVTVTLASNPAADVLGGTTVATASGGMASFAGLMLDRATPSG
jgi:regulation of enolase protein 1 (concanavalin A-like superfamily)